MSPLLPYREARDLLLERVPATVAERVSLSDALGRVLFEPVHADLDLPPFRKAFMDGYAVRVSDLEKERTLRVSGEIAAGGAPPPRLKPGEAAPIMTGAPVPEGADAVQKIEETRRIGEKVEILGDLRPGQHIAAQAQEVRKGEVVLEPGRLIRPAEVGVLATFGRNSIKVFRRPRVALVSTGSELVEIERTPAFGQIRNSNTWMLRAQCLALGLECGILPSVPDDPEQIRSALRRGLESDLLILSGGVSMGAHDYVHTMLADEGVEIFFHKAAVKPGKPLIVGRKGQRMVFGLPGNPVSALVTFEVFARPAIRKWMGFRQPGPVRVTAHLKDSIRHKPGRLFFKPALTRRVGQRLEVEGLETQGSADLVAFSKANSLLWIPADCSHLPSGARVEVSLLGELE